MRSSDKLAVIFLIGLSILLLCFLVYAAIERTLTPVEIIALQIITLLAGIGGSYLFGRQSAKDASREMIEPHARSAFRRLRSLYDGLSRVAKTIVGTEDDAVKLKIIEAILVEQISTADDALADWQDVVPESVAELTRTIDRPPDEQEEPTNG